MYFDVGERSDGLFLKLEFWVLLVGDVTDGSGKVQVAINPALDIHSRSSSVDSFSFFFLGWFVILREWNRSAALTNDASGITSVGTD